MLPDFLSMLVATLGSECLRREVDTPIEKAQHEVEESVEQLQEDSSRPACQR